MCHRTGIGGRGRRGGDGVGDRAVVQTRSGPCVGETCAAANGRVQLGILPLAQGIIVRGHVQAEQLSHGYGGLPGGGAAARGGRAHGIGRGRRWCRDGVRDVHGAQRTVSGGPRIGDAAA